MQEIVINRGRCYFLTYLHKQCTDLFRQSNKDIEETTHSIFTGQNLEEKNRHKFTD